jgi:hypothetical protein
MSDKTAPLDPDNRSNPDEGMTYDRQHELKFQVEHGANCGNAERPEVKTLKFYNNTKTNEGE